VGPATFVNLVVCWGSTYHAVREALETLKLPDTAMLHITQVHPFHVKVGEALAQAQRVITIENNATGQLTKLIKLTFGRESNGKILKYNGMSFSVEELVEKIGKEIEVQS
jgi:2-oxoglutarate ferredoxin oxidoreductase subunit alpha